MSGAMSRQDRLIPWYFVLFFVVLAVIDGTFATLAVRTHTGVVSQHPYEEGLAYNKTIDAAAAQEKLRYTAGIAYERNVLTFTLKDAQGAPVDAISARAEFRRMTDSHHDHIVTLNQISAGTYRAEIRLPLNGQWDVRVFAETVKGPFQHSERVIAK